MTSRKKESKHRRPKILLSGGSGLLGTELQKIDKSLIAPPRSELDITKPETIMAALEKYKPEIFIHAAAATRPPEHEKNPSLGLSSNILGTGNVALACMNKKVRLVYISTDYVYSGQGPHKEDEPILAPSKFVWSKLGGECSAALVPNSLILRLSFGKVPYEWDKVYEGQWTSKLYVDEIAPLILLAAKSEASGIMNIGGPRTTLADYARRTKPNIPTMPKPDWVPSDTSLDISLMRDWLNIGNVWNLLKH